jgi:transcription factor S
MEFCKKCGTIMMMKNGKVRCPQCNYLAKGRVDMKIREEIDERETVAVVNEKQGEMNPIVDHKCEKCGHKKAYFWMRQMRAADEAESKFYKCLECKIVERDDD